MNPSGTLPPLRAEFRNESNWEPLSDQLRRYEIVTPEIRGPVLGISRTVGCIHVGRASLIVRVGGGQLKAPTDTLLQRLEDKAPGHLGTIGDRPGQYVDNVVSWLEEEQNSGILEGTFTTVTLLVAVSSAEVWTWLVSPHGLAHGGVEGIVFGSTDLRYPVLRQRGVMQQPAFPFAGTEAADQASSIFCVGTQAGYERIRTHVGAGEALIAFERASLPFAPWPTQPIRLHELWAMDAAWKYGLMGRAVVLGDAKIGDLVLPHDWKVREVPLQGPHATSEGERT